MLIARHITTLWGRWWFIPFLPVVYLGFVYAIGDLRPEHIVIVAAIVFLGVVNLQTKTLLIAAIPGIAIGFGYEIVRYVRPMFVTADRVLGCELRDLEIRLFPAGPDLTWPEYFAANHSAALDIFFTIPYSIFWFVAVAYGILLFFINRPRMGRYLWTLAITHVVAFTIWMALPAAPPWYIGMHGCAIDIDALPNAAALLRIDALFGVGYFESFYSRAPSVFGALPSLHCAFPVVGLVTAWRDSGWKERFVHIAYAVWMFVASVYLVHHWLLDSLLGVTIVVVVYAVIARFFPRGTVGN